MPWARCDDTAHEHRKFKRAGLEATGLYYLALSYCARYLTDGHVDEDWIAERVPQATKREKLLAALVSQQLFEPNGTGYLIHDYLTFNPSREQVLRGREKDAERKHKERMSARTGGGQDA